MSDSDEDQGNQLIATIVAGEGSDVEHRLVMARRAADPAFEADFRRVRDLWEAAKLPYEKVRVPPSPSVDKIIALAERSAGRSVGRRFLAGSRLPIAAAGLVAVLGLGWWGLRYSVPQRAQSQAVFTGPDEVATVTLDDGTLIRVAPDSRLTFSASSRTVKLDGRAFFAVAHRNGQPFEVQLPNRVITVLGTRFDVEGRDEATRVAVLEGLVRVSGAGSDAGIVATVAKDQVAYGSDSGELLVQQVDDVYESVEWMGPFLAFEGTPLQEVALELLRRFDLKLSIAGPLSARTVTGWFTNTRPEAMVASICTAVAAQCTMDGDSVYLQERTPGSWMGLDGWKEDGS